MAAYEPMKLKNSKEQEQEEAAALAAAIDAEAERKATQRAWDIAIAEAQAAIKATADAEAQAKVKPKVPFEDEIPWSAYSELDLWRFFDQLKKHLPATKLDKIDMEAELLSQLHVVKALQGQVMVEDNGVAFNQKAQVANSVVSAMSKVLDMQVTVYSSERFKRIEGLLIRALSKLPEEQVTEFLTNYELLLKKYV